MGQFSDRLTAASRLRNRGAYKTMGFDELLVWINKNVPEGVRQAHKDAALKVLRGATEGAVYAYFKLHYDLPVEFSETLPPALQSYKAPPEIKVRELRARWLGFYATWYRGGFWFRWLGYGLSVQDRTIHPPLFSERNYYTDVKRIGKYSVKILKP